MLFAYGLLSVCGGIRDSEFPLFHSLRSSRRNSIISFDPSLSTHDGELRGASSPAPVVTVPVMVLSKRKNRKLREKQGIAGKRRIINRCLFRMGLMTRLMVTACYCCLLPKWSACGARASPAHVSPMFSGIVWDARSFLQVNVRSCH